MKNLFPIRRLQPKKHFTNSIADIKAALSMTISKCRAEIEEIHEKGNHPADYSLGFANALIFVWHRLNDEPGDPKFYNRTTSVGRLVRPIALKTDDELAKEKEIEWQYNGLTEAVVHFARLNPTHSEDLRKGLDALDEFIGRNLPKEGAEDDSRDGNEGKSDGGVQAPG